MSFIAAILPSVAGSKRIRVDTQNVSDSDSELSPTDAQANVTWTNTGNLQEGGINQFPWLLFGSASDYELFVTGTGDTPGPAALNTWQSMGSNLGYTLTVTGIGEESFSGTYSIRTATGHVVLGSGSIFLQAIVDV